MLTPRAPRVHRPLIIFLWTLAPYQATYITQNTHVLSIQRSVDHISSDNPSRHTAQATQRDEHVRTKRPAARQNPHCKHDWLGHGSRQSIDYIKLTHLVFLQRQLCALAESQRPLADNAKFTDVHPIVGTLILWHDLLHNLICDLIHNILRQQSFQLGPMIQHT